MFRNLRLLIPLAALLALIAVQPASAYVDGDGCSVMVLCNDDGDTGDTGDTGDDTPDTEDADDDTPEDTNPDDDWAPGNTVGDPVGNFKRFMNDRSRNLPTP